MKFTNFATSTLASGILAGATSLSVFAGDGAKFPVLGAGDYFYAVLENLAGAREIIKVTARTGDSFDTIVRAQDGTSALAWNAGDKVELRLVNLGLVELTASEIHDATNKATPVDADEIGIWDSVSLALRKVTWANLKATLKTYFDTIYTPLGHVFYNWSSWSPSDVAGTDTVAPSTGNSDYSSNVTVSNASGTVTVTFTNGGKYVLGFDMQTIHGEVFTRSSVHAIFGGTATRYASSNSAYSSDDSVNDTNGSLAAGFGIVATAGQTLTITPYFLVNATNVVNHTAYANFTITKTA